MDLTEFGAFLRSRRDRLSPIEVGLPPGQRRRVTGLRRDEVAQLAHLSVDYYIELERGIAQPSAMMVAELATALRVSLDERDHLYHLAERSLPPAMPEIQLLPAMKALLDRFDGIPAYVTTDLQVILAQNSHAIELHGPTPTSPDITSSFVYRWFTDANVRATFPVEDHDAEAKALIADLRPVVARHDPAGSDASRLVGELTARSPWFTELWNRREVAVRRHEFKRLIHPRHGLVSYDCHALLSEDATQRLIWYDRSELPAS